MCRGDKKPMALLPSLYHEAIAEWHNSPSFSVASPGAGKRASLNRWYTGRFAAVIPYVGHGMLQNAAENPIKTGKQKKTGPETSCFGFVRGRFLYCLGRCALKQRTADEFCPRFALCRLDRMPGRTADEWGIPPIKRLVPVRLPPARERGWSHGCRGPVRFHSKGRIRGHKPGEAAR